MIQEIITYIILGITAAYIMFSLFRFVKPTSQKTSGSSGCAGCPLMENNTCKSHQCVKE
jgi:hypothetical protein